MQQLYPGDIIKGYARRMINYPTYITQEQYTNNEKNKAIVDFRIKVIRFYEHYGIAATLAAFDISRATVFSWRKRLRDGGGYLVKLAPMSTRPHVARQPHLVTSFHRQEMIRLRRVHPRLGKDKLKVLLDQACLVSGQPLLSASTIGRTLTDLKASGSIDNYQRLRNQARTGRLHTHRHTSRIKKQRRGTYYPRVPGELLQIDCVIKFISGIRRYVISAIDYSSSFAYSYAYKTLSSSTSTDFFTKLQQVAPFSITHVQTDNGQEFHKHFYRTLQEQGLIHFFNYPRTPKSNGKIERYNRTIQEEFVDWHLQDMAYDLADFNRQLTDWLMYYNTERPHHSHRARDNPKQQIPPLRACVDMLQLSTLESRMLWTHTKS
jgi:transposase InsO family protein